MSPGPSVGWVVPECGGDLQAEVDERTDKGQKAAGAAGFGGGGGCRVRHERKKNTLGPPVARKMFRNHVPTSPRHG